VHELNGSGKKPKVRVFGTSAAVRKVIAAASLVEEGTPFRAAPSGM
jgi:hypothetical protein